MKEPEETGQAAETASERLAWRCAAASDVGRVREQNEDAYWVDDDRGLFVVADGMGGHAAGEIASSLAVRAAADGLALLPDDPTRTQARDRVRRAIKDANTVILIEGRARPERSGMGTTATVLFVSPDGWFVIGHVGDSRAYLVRNGAVSRITEDHTYVQELVNQGRLSDEEARMHPRSSLLTRALGTTASVPIDIYDGSLRPGDRLLLTSDGLTTMVPEDLIIEILKRPSTPETLVGALIDAANAAGGADNTTAIVVEMSGAD